MTLSNLEIAIDPTLVGLTHILPREPNRWRTSDGAFNIIFAGRRFHLYDAKWVIVATCRSWYEVQLEIEHNAYKRLPPAGQKP